MKRAKLLVQKFPRSATDFIFFTDEKVFSVASPHNRQNDRVYAPHDTRKRSIAAERLLNVQQVAHGLSGRVKARLFSTLFR